MTTHAASEPNPPAAGQVKTTRPAGVVVVRGRPRRAAAIPRLPRPRAQFHQTYTGRIQHSQGA
jgi:hypothetical protein